MGWSTTPTSEPNRKIVSYRKRCGRLRGAVRAQESLEQIRAAAEKVRVAKIALIKAHLSLISEYPQRDPQGRKMIKLCEEAIVWLSKSVEEIVREVDVEPGISKTRGTVI
jgi:hypothetical protein